MYFAFWIKSFDLKSALLSSWKRKRWNKSRETMSSTPGHPRSKRYPGWSPSIIPPQVTSNSQLFSPNPTCLFCFLTTPSPIPTTLGPPKSSSHEQALSPGPYYAPALSWMSQRTLKTWPFSLTFNQDISLIERPYFPFLQNRFVELEIIIRLG